MWWPPFFHRWYRFENGGDYPYEWLQITKIERVRLISFWTNHEFNVFTDIASTAGFIDGIYHMRHYKTGLKPGYDLGFKMGISHSRIWGYHETLDRELKRHRRSEQYQPSDPVQPQNEIVYGWVT